MYQRLSNVYDIVKSSGTRIKLTGLAAILALQPSCGFVDNVNGYSIKRKNEFRASGGSGSASVPVLPPTYGGTSKSDDFTDSPIFWGIIIGGATVGLGAGTYFLNEELNRKKDKDEPVFFAPTPTPPPPGGPGGGEGPGGPGGQ